MPYRTISALYQSRAEAEKAQMQLRSAGIAASDIEIHEQSTSGSTTTPERPADEGFLGWLKSLFGPEDSYYYAEGLSRGHVLLTARISDANADRAIRILDDTHPLDWQTKEKEWRASGWSGPVAAGAETKIPVIEERLKVGKREINRGTVRVRSYIVEEPVNRPVGLRQEHVTVERRPVNRPVENADELLKERSVELSETAEEAVVAKDAIVKEEVGLRKEVRDETANVKDKLRRTKVEVEDRRTSPKPR